MEGKKKILCNQLKLGFFYQHGQEKCPITSCPSSMKKERQVKGEVRAQCKLMIMKGNLVPLPPG